MPPLILKPGSYEIIFDDETSAGTEPFSLPEKLEFSCTLEPTDFQAVKTLHEWLGVELPKLH